MSTSNQPVTFVWSGDLHLTEAGLPNHRVAQALVKEVNELIRPDFVQFAGDNVQHARAGEFELFNALRGALEPPHEVLVGDHDMHKDPGAAGFGAYVGETYGSRSLRGFRFIRLNTLEHRPVGLSDRQVRWPEAEVDAAIAAGERPVLFQHHYPYKVWEQFAGPGLDEWRRIVQTRPIVAIFSGHTHYGQIANDGRNLSIATRSIGDPEGGPPGYAMVHLDGEDLALTYRTPGEPGPVVLITHPRAVLLATGPRHIVSDSDHVTARVWSDKPIMRVRGRIDEGPWFDLQTVEGAWQHAIDGQKLIKGEHDLLVVAEEGSGRSSDQRIRFMSDPTGRYTAIPGVDPTVKGTAFC